MNDPRKRYVYSLVQLCMRNGADRIAVAVVVGGHGEPYRLQDLGRSDALLNALGMQRSALAMFLDVIRSNVRRAKDEQELAKQAADSQERSTLKLRPPYPILATSAAEALAEIRKALSL